MIQRLIAISVIAMFAATAAAATWTEVGDAGDAPIGSAQTTVGVGSLDAIDGSMIWDPDGDHVDSYLITVTDPAAFFASTDPGDGGFFLDDQGNEDDSRLFLFTLAGDMVMANDDSPVGLSLESLMTDPSVWPGATLNSPGSVSAGEMYILAVTYFANNLLDAAGAPAADFATDFDALHGLNPVYGGNDSWDNPGDFDAGWTYRVALGGATYYSIPEPSTFGLLALAGLALVALRRRHA